MLKTAPLLVLLGTAAMPLFASHGSALDPSFGTNGTAAHGVTYAGSLIPAADDAFRVVGLETSDVDETRTMMLAEVSRDGEVSLLSSIAMPHRVWVRWVPVLAAGDGDGSISAVASSYSSSQWYIAVARFRPDGSPDASFGEGGVVEVPMKSIAGSRASQTDPEIVDVAAYQGRTLVLAELVSPPQDGSGYDFRYVVFALTSTGTIDQSFGSKGVAILRDWDGPDLTPEKIVVLPDGAILIGGSSRTSNSSHAAVWRLKANGGKDFSFGKNGEARAMENSYLFWTLMDFAVQPDGGIVTAGNESPGGPPYRDKTLTVRRFHSDGSVDTSFGGSGKTHLTNTHGYPDIGAMLVYADGSFAVAGRHTYEGPGSEFFELWRFTATGAEINDSIGPWADNEEETWNPSDAHFDSRGRIMVLSAGGTVFSILPELHGRRRAVRK